MPAKFYKAISKELTEDRQLSDLVFSAIKLLIKNINNGTTCTSLTYFDRVKYNRQDYDIFIKVVKRKKND